MQNKERQAGTNAQQSNAADVTMSSSHNAKPLVSGSFISDVSKITNDIIECFPKFFDDFKNWEYGTGVDAGKDFKKIFNKAKRLNKTISKNFR